jgi:hypothetical protein
MGIVVKEVKNSIIIYQTNSYDVVVTPNSIIIRSKYITPVALTCVK